MKLGLRTEGGGRSVVHDFFCSPGFCTRLCLCTRQFFVIQLYSSFLENHLSLGEILFLQDYICIILKSGK